MNEIKIGQSNELNGLAIALNHYVSTGDYIAMATAWNTGSLWHIIIPIRDEAEDKENFAKLRSRLEELPALHTLQYLQQYEEFHMWDLCVEEGNIVELGVALMERPGNLGWGSTKPTVDKFLSNSIPPGTVH